MHAWKPLHGVYVWLPGPPLCFLFLCKGASWPHHLSLSLTTKRRKPKNRNRDGKKKVDHHINGYSTARVVLGLVHHMHKFARMNRKSVVKVLCVEVCAATYVTRCDDWKEHLQCKFTHLNSSLASNFTSWFCSIHAGCDLVEILSTCNVLSGSTVRAAKPVLPVSGLTVTCQAGYQAR